MQTEPEQWARDLLEAVHDASDMGSACGMVDCPQCKAAALTIQRAFEKRERKLREALKAVEEEGLRNHNTRCRPWWNQVRQALKDTTHD